MIFTFIKTYSVKMRMVMVNNSCKNKHMCEQLRHCFYVYIIPVWFSMSQETARIVGRLINSTSCLLINKVNNDIVKNLKGTKCYNNWIPCNQNPHHDVYLHTKDSANVSLLNQFETLSNKGRMYRECFLPTKIDIRFVVFIKMIKYTLNKLF